MKERHRDAERLNARTVLTACKVPLGADFHTLSTSQVSCLLEEADRVRYQRPKGANGSRGRYFHDQLQRRAR
jgi:hypothetical protein